MIPSSFPVFTDFDGTPLEGGYIWVGAWGLNPETNTEATYFQSGAGGAPAVIGQPIRTIGGYPSSNGAPGRLSTISPIGYSITVRNKNMELIYTSLTETEASATYLPLTGGTVTGEILCSVTPTSPTALVRKMWVEANYLPLAGGTMSGPITYGTLPSASGHLVNKQYADQLVFPGMFAYAAFSSSIPTGWLLCNGSAISRTTYATLFAAIGTAYGTGDGVSTFNIPDGRGEFIRGFDNGRGIDSGRVFGSAQTDAFQGHFHTPPSGSSNFITDGGAGLGGSGSSRTVGNTGSPSTDGINGTPRTASETRPRNITGNLLIKY